MTLENCKLRLEVAVKTNNEKEVAFWIDRIAMREKKLGIVHLKKKETIKLDLKNTTQEVKKDGKKST